MVFLTCPSWASAKLTAIVVGIACITLPSLSLSSVVFAPPMRLARRRQLFPKPWVQRNNLHCSSKVRKERDRLE